MIKKTVIIIVLIVIAAAGFWLFNPARGTQVETTQAKLMPAVQAVYATGTVQASRMVPIAPKIAVRLSSIEMDEGSRVEQGQILAKLEDADIQESVKELEAQYELAQKDLARAQKLSKNGAISKEALDKAQASFKTATASLDKSKAELDYLQLTAPESGTIIRRDGEIGETITTGTAVFWLSGGNDLRIETEVDEEDIALVQPGQKVAIGADAFPNQSFEGTVQSITPKGDPVARSYRVRINLPQDTPLMIGMTAETNIITQEKDSALMIPAAAVKDSKVIVIAHGKAESRTVKTGIKGPQAIEITEGLTDKDSIAAKFDEALLTVGKIKTKPSTWQPTPDKK